MTGASTPIFVGHSFAIPWSFPTAKLSSINTKVSLFRRQPRDVRRKLSSRKLDEITNNELKDTTHKNLDGVFAEEIERWPPIMPFHRKRRGGDISAIFVHAGAGYHSVQNEMVHLQACAEYVTRQARMNLYTHRNFAWRVLP